MPSNASGLPDAGGEIIASTSLEAQSLLSESEMENMQFQLLSQPVPLTSLPSGYILLDPIQPGDFSPAEGPTLPMVYVNPSAYVGLPWISMDDFPWSYNYNPVFTRYQVGSPYPGNTPGSVALFQQVVGNTYFAKLTSSAGLRAWNTIRWVGCLPR